MPPKFRYLPDIAIADVAFEAYGKTLDELFANAALATEEVQADTKAVTPKVERTFTLEAPSLKELLFDFLQELVFYKDAELLIFSRYDVKVKKAGAKYALAATLEGDSLKALDPSAMRTDVKAVTLHMFTLEQAKEGYKCLVVLDI
jgi:SHS2 domain-containing protein